MGGQEESQCTRSCGLSGFVSCETSLMLCNPSAHILAITLMFCHHALSLFPMLPLSFSVNSSVPTPPFACSHPCTCRPPSSLTLCFSRWPSSPLAPPPPSRSPPRPLPAPLSLSSPTWPLCSPSSCCSASPPSQRMACAPPCPCPCPRTLALALTRTQPASTVQGLTRTGACWQGREGARRERRS